MAHPRNRRTVRPMIGLRFGVTVLLVGVLSVLASCSDGPPTQPPVDDTSIEAQIRALFPAGASLRDAALTQIADIRQQIALSATTQARSKTLALVDFTVTSFRDGRLVGGTSATAGNAASRLVNALYQLVGMDAPNLPDGALSNDGAAKVVGPEGALVVTPSGAAGVQIPAGALDQKVLVTVTRLPTPPTPGTGPLPTSLKQYPPYYDFSTFPAVPQFGSSARVGICQVTDPASPFYPPEPHDRLRLAHTVGGSIEVLDRVAVDDFLRCTGVSPSRSASGTGSFGWRGALASRVNDVISRLGPVELYAAHGGLGGKVKSFSPFAAVDPGPNPVLAFTGTEVYSVDNSNFVRYKLAVTNYQAYPAEMFAPAPNLPPCGLNTNASRTWVNVYDASNNSYIYGFCGFEKPSDLLLIWFAEPVGTPPPLQVYITLVDRATGVTYMSNNVVPIPEGTPPDAACGTALRSTADDTPTTIVFSNQTSETISWYWLDYNGNEVFYNSSAPGQVVAQPTFLTHPWVVKGASGQCYGIWLPSAESRTIVLR
jgi:hypothetical protein